MNDLPDVQMVFVSGIFQPEIWKHQEKYFSRSLRTEKIGGGSFQEVKERLEDMLDNCSNAVVIGAEYGNHVIQSLESHESVMSTVYTGPFDRAPDTGEEAYNLGLKFLSKPKVIEKLFFTDKCDYRITKEFVHRACPESFEKYNSYSNMDLEIPIKNSLTIYNQGCKFSSMDKVEELRPNSEIALIDAGSFSFFEKPQEFNKALHDFLQGKKKYLERRELAKAASENHSLKDFNKMRVKR